MKVIEVIAVVVLVIALAYAVVYGMANDPNLNGRVYEELRQAQQ